MRPSPGLAPWIECFWSIHAGPGPSLLNRVLPDGCSDLIVGVGGSPAAMIVGTMRTALVVPLAAPATLLGVRFHPGAALRILDTPLTELTDRRIPLDALWGSAADELSTALAQAAGPAGTRRAERLLAKRLAAPKRASGATRLSRSVRWSCSAEPGGASGCERRPPRSGSVSDVCSGPSIVRSA